MQMFIAVVFAALTLSSAPVGSVVVPVNGASLADGIMAVRGKLDHVTPEYSKELEQAVLGVVEKSRYSWISPALLLGIAADESDFRQNLRHGLDCGITQIRTTSHVRGWKAARKLCEDLRNDVGLAFEEAAKVLTSIRNDYCGYWWKKMKVDKKKYEWRFRRCLLNVYNQGPYYYRAEKCQNDTHRCWVKARYWNRITCFAVGIQLGKTSRWSCRRSTSDRWIRRAYDVSILPSLFNVE